MSIEDLQQISVRSLCQSLIDLGLLKGQIKQRIDDKSYQRFYMHRIGHWIGRDVHDVGSYFVNNQWRPFEAGMCLTIEPGLYIGDGDDIADEYRHIGVRIEDTILITENGYENLTAGLPRTVAEIEAFLEPFARA